MNLVVFPSKEDLRSWLEAIETTALNAFLPGIDEEWYGQMESSLQTTALRPDCRADLCRSGAFIFYKIIKNHYRIDGNKRSALLTTYLFFIYNQSRLTIEPDTLYELSREVAMGDEPMEYVIPSIQGKFQGSCDILDRHI